ncbi:MAG: helix-turn-helix transcriptional regulator [Prevotella sp.]|nr:helix-turn-helix transcriptional regulator [Candidatus Prevotella equi]
MKDRIRQLMDAQHMNQQSFSSFTGISSASLSSIFTGRTRPTLNHVDAIIAKFPTLNTDWLLTGSGGMFRTAGENSSAASDEAAVPSGTNSGNSSSPSDNTFFGSANMSVEPSLFNDHNNAGRATAATPMGNRNNPTSFQFSSDSRQMANNNNVITTPPRKITEIRIFYDDQTWETFVPKK